MRILLLSLALLLAACAAPAPSTVIAWTGDGNPGVPPCSAKISANCKSGIQIEDITTGQISTLPITAKSWLSPTVGHSFAARAIGAGESGPVTSPWAAARGQ